MIYHLWHGLKRVFALAQRCPALVSLILGFLLTAVSYPADAQPVGRFETIELINQNILPILKRDKIDGAAIIVYDHGIAHAFYYGKASTRAGDRVTANTAFEVGSVSKLFTSVLLALAVGQGRMHLTDSVTTYLPSLRTNFYMDSENLEDLATHVNGMPDMPGPRVKNKAQMIDSFSGWHPSTPIGLRWHYSNVGFGVLGYAIENSYQMSYGDVLKTQLLDPLHMTQTGITGYACSYIICAQGHAWNGVPVTTTPKLLIIPAAGSVQASGQDMQKFLAAALNLPGTPPAVARAMHLTQQPIFQTPYGGQALGWEVHELADIAPTGLIRGFNAVTIRTSAARPAPPLSPNVVYMFDKTGTVAGYRAYIAAVPARQSGIVILVNQATSRNKLVQAARRVIVPIASQP